MKKKGLLIATAALAGIAFHSYLDVMYKETIPKGPFKRLQEKLDNGDMEPLHQYTIKSNEWNDQQPFEHIELINRRNQKLMGYYLPADGDSKVFAVFAHGYRANHRGDPANFVKYYHEKGYHFFCCDHTAAGESEGDFVGFDYYEAQDMLFWIEYLVARFGKDIKIILHGVSMGGATVCKMASSVPEQVRLIVADCPYTGAKDEFISVANSVGITKTAPAIFGAMNWLNKRMAGYDLCDTDVRESVANAKAPMLFVHGGSDDFVPTYMGWELFTRCGSEKDILIIPAAKHADSIVWGTDRYLAKLDEFIAKHL